MKFGVTSNTARLVRVAVKSPRVCWENELRVTAEWQPLNYTGMPDLDLAIAQHDGLIGLLRDSGVDIDELPAHASTGLDSVYVHDPRGDDGTRRGALPDGEAGAPGRR
jgi:N-dimethylarginine dimethylaminohydrolase